MNIEITYNTILAFFGAVAVIGGGVKIIIQALNPFKEVKAKVKKHDEYFESDKKRLDKVDETLDEISKEQRLQGKALMVLISHLITGNDTEKLKKTYQDLLNHYIDM